MDDIVHERVHRAGPWAGFTPHVAHNNTRQRSAIDGRTTRHAGYAISMRIRKRIEETFGWIKTIGGVRKLRYIGRQRTQGLVKRTAAVCNPSASRAGHQTRLTEPSTGPTPAGPERADSQPALAGTTTSTPTHTDELQDELFCILLARLGPSRDSSRRRLRRPMSPDGVFPPMGRNAVD